MPKFKAKVVVCTTYTVEAEADNRDDFVDFVQETDPGDGGWVEETCDDEIWAIEGPT